MTTLLLGGTIEQAEYAFSTIKRNLKDSDGSDEYNARLGFIANLIEQWKDSGERPETIYGEFFSLNIADGTINTGALGPECIIYALVYENITYFYVSATASWYYTYDLQPGFIIKADDCIKTNNGLECFLIIDDMFPTYSPGKSKLYGVHYKHSIFTLDSPSDLVISDKCKISFKSNKFIITPPESVNRNEQSCRFYFPTVYLEFGKKYYLVDALFTASTPKILLDDYKICTYERGIYLSKNGPAIKFNHITINCLLAPGATYHSPISRIPYKNVGGHPITQIEKYVIKNETYIITTENFVRQVEPIVYCMRIINLALYAYLFYIIVCGTIANLR